MILVDTIPLRLAQPNHVQYPIALGSLDRLRSRDGEDFVIAPQSLFELYVVATRPTNVNGLGLTVADALIELATTKSLFATLPETAQVFPTWEALITQYKVVGKRAHDIRLVAVMKIHRITKILTFNDADFRNLSEVQALNPFDVLSLPRA